MDELGIEEYREAIQYELNEENDKIAAASEKNRLKFEAVGKALKILTEAGVKSYMFPILPLENGKEGAYQFNNGGDFIEWVNGKISFKSRVEAHFMNTATMHSFLYSFLAVITRKEAGMEELLNRCAHGAIEFSKWQFHGELPEALKDI